MGYLMPKLFFIEDQQWYYLTYNGGGEIRRFNTLPEVSSPKVNVIALLEFEI